MNYVSRTAIRATSASNCFSDSIRAECSESMSLFSAEMSAIIIILEGKIFSLELFLRVQQSVARTRHCGSYS